MSPDDEEEDTGVHRARMQAIAIRDDINVIRGDLTRIKIAQDDIEKTLGDLRATTGRLEGEMRIMLISYERAATLASSQALADLEVRKTGELAAIEDGKERARVRRQLLMKLAAGAGGIWAIVSAIIAHGC